MERVWGGRNLERLYGKTLPPQVSIGESWEITDRPEGVSVIQNGPWAGRDLRWLMEHHQKELLGPSHAQKGRFPLLIKMLDAQDKLSLQVHPPPHAADALNGEPKTEMWYIAEATPEAELFVGLKSGVTREEFQRRISDGSVADCFHKIQVRSGDAIFLPSGRVHAIGAGNVIFEIQQNSDTTYRVFDWNRLGLDGKPRTLHVEESMKCIDFSDVEPSLIQSKYSRNSAVSIRYLVNDPLFSVDAYQVRRRERFYLRSPGPSILGLLKGRLEIAHEDHPVMLEAGQFCLIPACVERVPLVAHTQVNFLQAQPG